MPLTERTTSPATKPLLSATEPSATRLMIGWMRRGLRDWGSWLTLKNSGSKLRSSSWKPAPSLVSSVSLTSFSSRGKLVVDACDEPPAPETFFCTAPC